MRADGLGTGDALLERNPEADAELLADGLRLQLEECEKQLPAQPDAAREEEHAAWCERLEKAIARQEAERT